MMADWVGKSIAQIANQIQEQSNTKRHNGDRKV